MVAHVPPKFWIFGDHHVAGNIVPCILCQVKQDRQIIEVDLLNHDLLAGRIGDHLRRNRLLQRPGQVVDQPVHRHVQGHAEIAAVGARSRYDAPIWIVPDIVKEDDVTFQCMSDVRQLVYHAHRFLNRQQIAAAPGLVQKSAQAHRDP